MTAQFDWDQFERAVPAQQQSQAAPQVAQQSAAAPQEFDWEQFAPAEQAVAEKAPSQAIRHVARTGSRIAETIAGLPSDIMNLPIKAGRAIAEKITGKKSEEFDDAYKFAKAVFPGANLPGSEELKQQAIGLSKGYLAPQSKGEEISDEFASDFASLAIPVKGKVPFLKSIGKALGVSAFATGAAETAEALGAEEGGKGATKMGAMFLGSVFNPKGASKYVSDLYSEAKNLLPEGARAPAKNLSKELSSLSKELSKGGSAASKTKAIQKIGEINGKISKGTVPVDELTEFKKSINEARSGLYEEFKSDKAGRKAAKRNLDAVSKTIDSSLNEYGAMHPEWNKVYQDANQGYAAIAQSKKVSTNIARTIKQNPHIASGTLIADLFLVPKIATAAGVAGGISAVKSVELMSRIAKSPVLRKYYSQAINAAIKEDSAALARNLGKLDEEVGK